MIRVLLVWLILSLLTARWFSVAVSASKRWED